MGILLMVISLAEVRCYTLKVIFDLFGSSSLPKKLALMELYTCGSLTPILRAPI